MSEELIKTVCTNCGMVYELDRSLIGQQGECAECGTAFDIVDQTDYVNQMLAQQNEPVEEAEQPVADEPATEEPVPQPAEAVVEEIPSEANMENTESVEPAPTDVQDDVQAENTAENPPTESAPTNTVKIPRFSANGMIPEIKDTTFKVGTIKVASQMTIGSSRGNRRFTNARKVSSSAAQPAKKKRWWEFWK